MRKNSFISKWAITLYSYIHILYTMNIYMHFIGDSGYPLEPWLLTCIGTIADSNQSGIQQGKHQDKKYDRTVYLGYSSHYFDVLTRLEGIL